MSTNGTVGAVGVVGAGEWAAAVATLAAQRGTVLHRTAPPGADAPGEPSFADLGARARLILLVLPSAEVRATARVLGDYLHGGHLLVHGTRGLEPHSSAQDAETGTGAGTGDGHEGTTENGANPPTAAAGWLRISEVLREETPAVRLGALAGPTLAGEVKRGQPTVAVVGSRFPEVIDAVREALAGPTFRVYGSDDLCGVELAAALSPVVALAAGLAAGLGLEFNTRAAVVVRGFAEMARLGASLGAKPATFTGLAGLGDLLASAQSDASADFRLGRALGQGTPLAAASAALQAEGATAEGLRMVGAVQHIAARNRVRVSLTDGLGAILAGADPREVVRGLMTLAPMSEAG
ncbi:MAG TPA: NAD(P)H-dependent glycerol-3-phosphate dehydrogenase [Myxococcota bacterium]|nr:NAD(P)H-dependent glycerol-3-phosphate dehydrogenase [Myxococcota bacterium]